jgi:hypothetical protein
MTPLSSGSVITAKTRDNLVTFSVDGDVAGRARDGHIELGDLRVAVRTLGERRGLVDEERATVLRLDRAGAKATWLTLANGRHRLAKQRGVPLMRRWVLTDDLEGPKRLTVTQTPVGTRVVVDDVDGLDARQVTALVIGALVEALGLGLAADGAHSSVGAEA